MNNRIWKFAITPGSLNIPMPAGAEILTAQAQGYDGCLWAAVDPDARPVVRRVEVIGTGHHFGGEIGRYVATYQESGGALVWHVFDLGET